jgi:hypothetical protein
VTLSLERGVVGDSPLVARRQALKRKKMYEQQRDTMLRTAFNVEQVGEVQRVEPLADTALSCVYVCVCVRVCVCAYYCVLLLVLRPGSAALLMQEFARARPGQVARAVHCPPLPLSSALFCLGWCFLPPPLPTPPPSAPLRPSLCVSLADPLCRGECPRHVLHSGGHEGSSNHFEGAPVCADHEGCGSFFSPFFVGRIP